jgi:Tfp pilus assembly protein PilN
MSTLTDTRTTALPRVNLLPPEIAEQRRARQVQGALAAGVLAAVGVAAVLVVLANGQVGQAEDELAASKQRNVTLQKEADRYAEVPKVFAQVDAARTQLELAMGKEIRWSYFLNDLSLKTPNQVWLTQMTVEQTVDTDLSAAAVAPAPGATEAYLNSPLGTVSFQGKATGHNGVAAWLDSLAKQKGFDQPYFTESMRDDIGDEQAVKFDSKVAITDEAFSGRYTQKAGR